LGELRLGKRGLGGRRGGRTSGRRWRFRGPSSGLVIRTSRGCLTRRAGRVLTRPARGHHGRSRRRGGSGGGRTRRRARVCRRARGLDRVVVAAAQRERDPAPMAPATTNPSVQIVWPIVACVTRGSLAPGVKLGSGADAPNAAVQLTASATGTQVAAAQRRTLSAPPTTPLAPATGGSPRRGPTCWGR